MAAYLNFMVITKIKIEKGEFERPNEKTLQEIRPWIERDVDITLFDFNETSEYWIYSMKDEYIRNYLYDFIYNELIGFNSEEDLKNLVELKNMNSDILKKYDENETEHLEIRYGKLASVFYWRDWHRYFAIPYKNRWRSLDVSGFSYFRCGHIQGDNEDEILGFTQMLIQTQLDNPLRKATKVLVG